MITKFKELFENKINIDDIKVDIKNEDKKLVEKIKQELSIISYKKKNSPKTIRIKDINGYFNNTDFKKINLIYRTYINIKMSNDDDLKAKLSVFKDEKNINIKINNEIVSKYFKFKEKGIDMQKMTTTKLWDLFFSGEKNENMV